MIPLTAALVKFRLNNRPLVISFHLLLPFA